MKWVIISFKPFKSPGPDGLFPAQIQRTLDTSLPWLTAIFNECIALNHIPSRWLDAKVICIPANSPSPTQHRPKSLSSFLLKTLERLIDIHIRLTTNPSHLSDAQHAYRKGRSTDTALHSLVSCIERGFRNKEYSLEAYYRVNFLKIFAI